MKIALFTAKPNKNVKKNVSEKRPPNGIGFLYSVMKQNKIDAEIYDRYCGNLYWDKDNFKSYDFVGIYANTCCWNDVKDIIEKLDAKYIAVGGSHVPLFPQSIPNKVTFAHIGEAEHSIMGMIEYRKKSNGLINSDRLTNRELDLIPRFPYELFYNKYRELYLWSYVFDETVNPVFTMNTSRGCPYNCSFCSVRKIWGRRYTYMSAQRVFDDIKYIVSIGGKGVYFREDNFTVNNQRIIELCELLIKNNVNIKWACETRVDTVDGELMELMSRAGCIGFYIGVEHLSQRMLNIFNKEITVDNILNFFNWAHKYNMKTAASFIIKHPEEIEDDRKEKERLLPVIKPDIIWDNPYFEKWQLD